MPEKVQIVLLAVAIAVLLAMGAVQMFYILRLRGDVEKFGRLLLKLRRIAKLRIPIVDSAGRPAEKGTRGG